MNRRHATPEDEVARNCGTCHPPADDTRDREVVDRFRDFLAVAGTPVAPGAKLGDIDPRTGRPYRLRTPAERWRLKYLAWRIGTFLPWEG